MYYAAYASQRRDENLRGIRAFLADIWLWPYDERAAEEFGRIQAEQKVKGRPIPQIDAQIAAVARLQRLTLLTADQHFQSVTGLTIENWLIAD
jgi:tRNA(fMet)-specific endonuclease VapC